MSFTKKIEIKNVRVDVLKLKLDQDENLKKAAKDIPVIKTQSSNYVKTKLATENPNSSKSRMPKLINKPASNINTVSSKDSSTTPSIKQSATASNKLSLSSKNVSKEKFVSTSSINEGKNDRKPNKIPEMTEAFNSLLQNEIGKIETSLSSKLTSLINAKDNEISDLRRQIKQLEKEKETLKSKVNHSESTEKLLEDKKSLQENFKKLKELVVPL